MDFRIQTEPHKGTSYPELLRLAQHAEDLGFSGFFCSDHYAPVGSARSRPRSMDAWTTLAGLSRETRVLRLGTLMSAATFRHPSTLAIAAAQVNEMSGGRLEVGLGAGWNESEHAKFGIYLPELRERFDRLAEQLAILDGLWSQAGAFDFHGAHYVCRGAPTLLAEGQDPPPLIIGGLGRLRTPMLAARHAAEYNIPPFQSLSKIAEQAAHVRQACEQADRDPATLTISAYVSGVCCGADDREVQRRLLKLGAVVPRLERYIEHGAIGTQDRLLETFEKLRTLGIGRIYLAILDASDLEHVSLLAETLLTERG